MESRKVFWASPTVTATETARQRCPAQPKALSLMICVAMLHVGVRQNDDVILRAALALRALAVGSGARVNVSRDRSRTNKADRAHFGMVEQRVHRRFCRH